MAGNMRRLPPWMLAGASSGVPAKSNRTGQKSVEIKRKHEPEEGPKTRPRRSVKNPKERVDSEEPKKVEIKTRGREERVRNKIGEDEEEAKPSIDVAKNPEIFQLTGPEDEDFTVDDLLSFAKEYVKGEEDQTIKDREGLEVVDESNMRLSSQGRTKEPNVTREPTANDMLNLLLGPFFQ